MKASTTNGIGLDSYRIAVKIIQIAPMFGDVNKIATKTISSRLWGNHGPITIHPRENVSAPISRTQKTRFIPPPPASGTEE
jgi:hypothetical protein